MKIFLKILSTLLKKFVENQNLPLGEMNLSQSKIVLTDGGADKQNAGEGAK